MTLLEHKLEPSNSDAVKAAAQMVLEDAVIMEQSTPEGVAQIRAELIARAKEYSHNATPGMVALLYLGILGKDFQKEMLGE